MFESKKHPPTLRAKPKDLQGLDIQLREDEDGALHLAERSSCTASIVRLTFPLLESEVRRVLESVQQRREQGRPELSAKDLQQRYQIVGYFSDDGDLSRIQHSAIPGSIEPREFTVNILSKRLQMDRSTIKRYSRQMKTRPRPSR